MVDLITRYNTITSIHRSSVGSGTKGSKNESFAKLIGRSMFLRNNGIKTYNRAVCIEHARSHYAVQDGLQYIMILNKYKLCMITMSSVVINRSIRKIKITIYRSRNK